MILYLRSLLWKIDVLLLQIILLFPHQQKHVLTAGWFGVNSTTLEMSNIKRQLNTNERQMVHGSIQDCCQFSGARDVNFVIHSSAHSDNICS